MAEIRKRLFVCLALAATAVTTEDYLHWACLAGRLQARLPEVVDESHPEVVRLVRIYSLETREAI